MKKRNYFILFFLSVAIAVSVWSCVKNPLNQKPTGSYTTANYWRNESDVLAGVNGIYNVLFTEDWVGHNIYIYDDQSDDISVDGDHPDFKAIERFNIDPTLQVIYTAWPFAMRYKSPEVLDRY